MMTSSKSSASTPQIPPLPFTIPHIVVHEPDSEQGQVLDMTATAVAENEAESKPDQINISSSFSKPISNQCRSRLSCLPVFAILSRYKREKGPKSPESTQNIVPRKPAPPLSAASTALSPMPPSRPAPRPPPGRGMGRHSRPAPNEYGRVPGISEPVQEFSSQPQVLAKSLQPANAEPSHRRERSYSGQALHQPSHLPLDEIAWRTSHPIPASVHTKPAPIPYPGPGQPQPAQRLMLEQHVDPPRSPQKLMVKVGPSPRSVSQPSPHSHYLHKPSAELLRPQNRVSPDTSPRASPCSSPIIGSRGRSVSLAPPTFIELGALAVPQSPGLNSPVSPLQSDVGSQGADSAGRKRLSWMPGSRSRHSSQDISGAGNGPAAWYYGELNREYNIQLLENTQRVPELWQENGDTYVYLFPLETGRGPSFRVASSTFSSSPKLMLLAFGEQKRRARAKSFNGRVTLSAEDATRKLDLSTPPYTPRMAPQDNMSSSDGSAESISSLGDSPKEGHLNFPPFASNSEQPQDEYAMEQLEHLISVRNLFAFLTMQPLVATRKHPTIFAILLEIVKHLGGLGFSNIDGSTYGEAASASLQYYTENLGLVDVRDSREKALEAIVLGEQLRSVDLYNEAFSHAIGRYESTSEMKSPVWDMISPNTRNRMELAYMDLCQRQKGVQLRLTDFEFPSLFTGVAASTSTAENRAIHFKAWKSSFSIIRKFTLSYYKDLHGSWPPRAKDKRNNFNESGLNRLVLKGLYQDFGALYNLLVDRDSLTTRSMDANDTLPEGEEDLAIVALRKVLSEFDHSSPPIQPPVPFDVPKIPTILTVQAKNNEYPPKLRTQNETRKLQLFETTLILTKSHNLDSDFKTPFLQAFGELEEKEARGKSAQDLADQRFGYWLFVYAILQSLPMLIIDAPGVKHSQGVEYFLCVPPKGGLSWMEDSPSTRRAWYGVANGTGVVALPSDIVQHGVEGVYRRSYCWEMAEKWLAQGYGPPTEEEHKDGNGSQSILGSEHDTQSTQSDAQTFIGNPEPRRSRRPSPARGLSVVTEEIQGHINAQSLHPQSACPSHRSRSRTNSPSHNHRRSIAYPLEQLPLPPGYNMSPRIGAMPSPPLGAGFSHSHRGSEDNTPTTTTSSALLTPDSGMLGASMGGGKKNFDEILSGMEPVKKEKGRMSFIGF